jgi:hypothetical protein
MGVAYFQANPYDPKNGMEECLLRRCFMSFFQPGAAGLVFSAALFVQTSSLFLLGMPYISGWWFQTFFIFHNIWDNPSH